MKTAAVWVLVSSVALAAPLIKTPTWRELLAGDMVAKARVRWVQVNGAGQRTVVEIQGGEAYRTNPGLSNQAQPLKYDLARNRKLEKALKAANWPSPTTRTARESDRTLELLGEADQGWVIVGTWTAPLKNWQRGKWASICDELEPLMKVQADVFGTMKTP
jgi:galactose mutarotase-like enzyme